MTTGLALFDRLPLELRFMIYRYHSAESIRQWNRSPNSYDGKGGPKALQKISKEIREEIRIAVYQNTTFTLHGSREIGGNLLCFQDSGFPNETSWIQNLSIGMDLSRVFNRDPTIIFEQGRLLRGILSSLKVLHLHLVVDTCMVSWNSAIATKKGLKCHLRPWSSVPIVKVYVTEGERSIKRDDRKNVEGIVGSLLRENMTLADERGNLKTNMWGLENVRGTL